MLKSLPSESEQAIIRAVSIVKDRINTAEKMLLEAKRKKDADAIVEASALLHKLRNRIIETDDAIFLNCSEQ